MKNNVSLQGFYGGDVTHAAAAWCSTYRKDQYNESQSEAYSKRIERIPGLLKMLAENEHGTPFERSLLHFSATVDTVSHIHLLKHRHFSINGESARYKEYTEDKYYIPEDWNSADKLELYDSVESGYEEYHALISERQETLGRKRAKESARYFLPFAIQVNLDFSCNFRAFAHFQKLRNSEHAQLEIREIAQSMLDQVKNNTEDNFKYSLKAWGL